jgi:hypothetical protein
MISDNKPGWERMLPEGVSQLIKEQSLFGCETEEILHKRD